MQAFALRPYHLFNVPKIHDVAIRRDLARPELQPDLVVVPVQLFTESFVGDKMRGIELEIFFHDAYFVGGGGGGHLRGGAGPEFGIRVSVDLCPQKLGGTCPPKELSL